MANGAGQEGVLWMEEAFKEAEKAFLAGEVPVGAVLVFRGHIIARGHNKTEKQKNACSHAEMVCLEEGAKALQDFRLTGSTLYTTLEPCIMCSGALILSRVAKVVYACSDLRHGAAGSLLNVFAIKHPIHQVLIEKMEGMEGRSAQMLKDFFKLQRQNAREIRGNDRDAKEKAPKNSKRDCPLCNRG